MWWKKKKSKENTLPAPCRVYCWGLCCKTQVDHFSLSRTIKARRGSARPGNTNAANVNRLKSLPGESLEKSHHMSGNVRRLDTVKSSFPSRALQATHTYKLALPSFLSVGPSPHITPNHTEGAEFNNVLSQTPVYMQGFCLLQDSANACECKFKSIWATKKKAN